MTALRVTLSAGPLMRSAEPLEPDTWETTAEEFIADNGFDDGDETDKADAAWLRTMPVGSAYNFGGGAGPLITVERIG